MQVTWHLLGMFFREICEIFRTGFTRNTHECPLLRLFVAGKCFDLNIFFKKYLIRFDIQWHVLPGIKTFEDLSWCLSWFVLGLFSSLLFVLYSSGQVATSRSLSRLHIKSFFLNEKFRETVGRKKNCELNFFSMYFIRNKKEKHLPFKNSEK